MPEEIIRDVFRLEIPLPGNPLKALNSYVIRGQDRHLIIDCGMRQQECREAMLAGLSELGIELPDTDFFITHFHADHLGLVSDLASNRSTIYLNEPDASRILNSSLRQEFARLARLHGFPPQEIDKALTAHPGSKYGPQLPLDFVSPEDGQVIKAGRYTLRCIATPGHSFGHLCLYEEEQKFLLSGDHILADITPNIAAWFGDWNALEWYLRSLDKVAVLDVRLVLPGHRRIFTEMRARLEQLKQHHAARAEEVLQLVKAGPATAYQLASHMTWDFDCDSFERFPVSQRWFATGEAIAHLAYLEGSGKVRKSLTSEHGCVWEGLSR